MKETLAMKLHHRLALIHFPDPVLTKKKVFFWVQAASGMCKPRAQCVLRPILLKIVCIQQLKVNTGVTKVFSGGEQVNSWWTVFRFAFFTATLPWGPLNCLHVFIRRNKSECMYLLLYLPLLLLQDCLSESFFCLKCCHALRQKNSDQCWQLGSHIICNLSSLLTSLTYPQWNKQQHTVQSTKTRLILDFHHFHEHEAHFKDSFGFIRMCRLLSCVLS